MTAMTEEQMNALVRCIRAARTHDGSIESSLEEQDAEELLRNAFGLHQHHDKSGPYFHEDHDPDA